MAKKFKVINRLNDHFGHILEYVAPMMEGRKALGYVLKIGEGNSKAFYYHEVEEIRRETTKSAFQQWYNNNRIDFGGFATALFEAYKMADTRNKERLESAFPDYF